MFSLLTFAMIAPAVAAEPADNKAEPPAKLELFAKEDWYKGQKGKEEAFAGVLLKADRKGGGIGFGRFNPYRLVMSKDSREVYVGSQGKLLEPYVNKRVRLIGKAVDMEVEGSQHREIWPARLEVLTAEQKEKPKTGGAIDDKALRDLANIAAGKYAPPPGPLSEMRAQVETLRTQQVELQAQRQTLLDSLARAAMRGDNFTQARLEEQYILLERRLTAVNQAIVAFESEIQKRAILDRVSALAGPKQVKLLAQGPWSLVRIDPEAKLGQGQTQHVIKSLGDLIKASGLPGDGKARAQLARALKEALNVEDVDYEKHMLVIVTGGTQPSGGYRVEIVKGELDQAGKKLTVHWRLHAPQAAATAALTHPAAIALVDRFDGDIQFAGVASGPGPKPMDPPAREPSDTPGAGASTRPAPQDNRQIIIDLKDGREMRILPLFGVARVGDAKGEKPTGKEVKILGRAFLGGKVSTAQPRPGAQTTVIRTEEDFVKLVGKDGVERTAKSLKVESIDFKKQMLVHVTGGVFNTGGYRVEITKAEADEAGKNLTVHWTLHRPKPGSPVTQAFTHPGEIVLVDKFEGDVKFTRTDK